MTVSKHPGFDNPWVELALQQIWLYRKSLEVAEKCVDADLLSDPVALSDHCLNPSEQRLNPIEFHGRRRTPAPRPSSTATRREQPANGSRS